MRSTHKVFPDRGSFHFASGPVRAGPCVTGGPVHLQGALLNMGVNDQPGTLTLHFDSLVSEVRVVPEPHTIGVTGALLCVLLAGRRRHPSR
jgi:hypothetical protein